MQHVAETGSTLVYNALQLLSLNRIIERSWHLTGAQNLGIPAVGDAGVVPITPTMDVQLDQIVIQDFLMPLAKRLLGELQTKMYARKRQDLFDIFLAVYVLATNIEFLLRHSRGNAIRHEAPRRYNSIPLAKAYVKGHNVILAHFHYFARGSPLAPLKAKAARKLQSSGLTDEQLRFVREVQESVAALADHTKVLREGKRYEAEMYWSHQMFLDDWMPESEDIMDEIALC